MSLINVDTIESRVGGPPTLSKGVLVSAAATFSGDLTRFDGAVSIGGTLTYEDVTNVDAIGIVTARGGMQFGAAGVGGTVTSVGNATFAGIVTASSFVGNLTGTASDATAAAAGLSVSGGNLTVGSGVTIGPAGVATFSGTSDIHLHDNVQLNIGDGSDCIAYHDGTHTYITNTTGDLRITDTSGGGLIIGSDSLNLRNSARDENYFVGTNGGAAEIYHNNNKKIETLSTGVNVTGVTSTTSLTVGPGVIQEKLYNVASALTGTVNFDVVTNGLVQYHTTNSSATWVVNLRGDGSTTLNSLLHIGQTTVFTLYSAQNNASYYMTDFQIDGSSQTEKWNGGSAPSAGTASGVDVYTFNIMKTADATFTVFANFANFA